MRKMKVLFVDDDKREVDQVMTTLEGTGLFDLTFLDSYGELGRNRDEILEAVKGHDLLVLDVYVPEGQPQAFMTFVNVIAQARPYLAYTSLTHRAPLLQKYELKEWVLSNGGLGVISKAPDTMDRGDLTSEDMKNRLIERILWFYWTIRTAVDFQG